MSIPRGDIGRNHDFVFAAFESFERLDAFTLRPIGMQHRHRMLPVFQFVRDAIGAVFGPAKISALSKFVRSSSAMRRSNFCSAATG
jgi:hypothetical protein